MRPLQLAIEGLRSFRAAVTVEFAGRDHVAIVGDTGAGKSSILEAITYALYGQTTFSSHANQELMNDTSRHLRVVLRFRVSGETWEVARTLRRDGQGRVGSPTAQLRRIGPGGETVEQVEQVRHVNDRIQALLGLDSDAFLRTVILPQGRFARLLVEDKPTERGRILRQVWRTDELEAAGALAGAARHEAANLRVRLDQAASAWPDDVDAHLAQLERARTETHDRAETASATERDAATARDALADAAQAQRTASDAVARLRGSHLDRAAERLAPITTRAREIENETAALDQRRTAAEQRLAQVPDDSDGPGAQEVASALATLPGVIPLVTAAETAAGDARTCARAAARRLEDARGVAERAASAERTSVRHAEGRPPLAAAADTAKNRRQTAEHRYAGCQDRQRDVQDAATRLAALRNDRAGVADELESARAVERSAGGERAAADERLAAARRSESAAAAARGLHPGDGCPVCLRSLPAGWTAPSGAGLSAAERAADDARVATEEARDRATTLGEKLNGIERHLSEVAARGRTAEEAFGTAVAALGTAVGAALRGFPDRTALLAPLDAAAGDALRAFPDRAALLAPLDAAAQAAVDALAHHDREHEQLRSAWNALSMEAAAAREAATGAGRLAEAKARAAGDALTRAGDAVRAVPPPFRPALDLPADAAELEAVDTTAVGGRTKAARTRDRVLSERANERDRLRSALADADEERAGLLRRKAADVERPLGDLARDLDAHRFVLVKAATDIGLDADLPEALPPDDAAALERRIDALQEATKQVARAAAEHKNAASKQAAAARETLAAIAAGLDGGIDAHDADAVAAAARDVAEDARFAARRATEEADGFAAVIDGVRRLRELLDAVRERERSLGDLEAALKPGAFPKWLTMRRSRSLLVHASRMLGEMSDGRYAFAEPADADEQWQVLDTVSGRARSPASLSGGEQFIAALSLALGLVEMMARGGGRLESLFLDEGFGSLDRNNLDAAVQALGTVAAGGRMVGVISHVRAVAEQIDHVLAVTRGAAGTRAEWLTDRQRGRLSESDAEWEAASALAGLLE